MWHFLKAKRNVLIMAMAIFWILFLWQYRDGPYIDIFALADPDIITIEQVRRYTSVGVTGDALFVVHYDLEYTVAPTETISEGWISRLMDVGGAGQLASVAPSAHELIPDDGYNHGIYSFYFTTAPVATGTLTITLEGNPGLSPTPVGITTSSIEDRAQSDLVSDMRLLALHLETVWGGSPPADVITFVGGVGRLTSDGEEYFGAAVPNLTQFAPTMFTLGFIQPSPDDHVDAPDTAYQTARDSFWNNTPVRDATTGMAATVGFPRPVFETILVLILAAVLGGIVFAKLQNQEIAIFVALLWINVAAYMGLGPLALPYILAATGVFAVAYLLFFKPSST